MDDKNRNFANVSDNGSPNQPQNGTVLALKDLGEQTVDEINCYINGQKRFVEFTKKEKEILQNVGLSNLSILQAQVLLARAKKLELLYKEKTTDAEERLAFIDEILKNSKNKRFKLDGDKLIVDEQVVEKIKVADASSLENVEGDKANDLGGNDITKTQEIDILLKALEKLTGKTFDRSLFAGEGKNVSKTNTISKTNETEFVNHEILDVNEKVDYTKESSDKNKSKISELSKVDNYGDGEAKSGFDNDYNTASSLNSFSESAQNSVDESTQSDNDDTKNAQKMSKLFGDEGDENAFDISIDESTNKSKMGKDSSNEDDLDQTNFNDLLDDIEESAGSKNIKSKDEKDEAETTNISLNGVAGNDNTNASPTDASLVEDDFYATSTTAFGNVGGDQLEEQELVNVYALTDGAIDFCNPQNAKLMYGIYMESTFEETFNAFLDVAYTYPLSLLSLPDEALEVLRKHNTMATINGIRSDINTLEYLVRLGASSIVKAKNSRSKDTDKIKYYEWCKKISF